MEFFGETRWGKKHPYTSIIYIYIFVVPVSINPHIVKKGHLPGVTKGCLSEDRGAHYPLT